MNLLMTSVVLGIVTGMLYALSGAGLVVIYRTSGYVSFAQGDIAAIGLFAAYYGLYRQEAPYVIVAVAVVVLCALVGGVLGSLLVVPMERFGTLSAALATIALGMMIQGGEGATVGGEPRAFPSVGREVAVRFGDVALSVSDLTVVAVSVAIFLALGLLFRRSRVGVAMRAVNDNPEAADLLGLPAAWLKRASWAIAGGLAGVSALFIVPIFSLTPTSVNAVLLYGFCAIVVGGFDSVLGALAGGLLIGIASNLTSAYVSPNLVTTAVYLTLLLVLLLRPYGLLGRRPIERV